MRRLDRKVMTDVNISDLSNYLAQIQDSLTRLASEEKAQASQRYFPTPDHHQQSFSCLGCNASDIKTVIKEFHQAHSDLSAQDVLAISEYLLQHAKHHEQTLVAFGLLTKLAKRNFDDGLLERFRYWLEHYASNWAHVDDLCLKTIYQFLLSRPHLITEINHWAYSDSPWCRRAANVVWVKFIERKIGKQLYQLDLDLVFSQCDLLISDQDEYVQKSIGWLLKVASQYQSQRVIEYLEKNVLLMPRSTLRYAIEKLQPIEKSRLMSIKQ
jgi:3-methyladenine DNA glycosylase AlkD